MVEKYSVRTDLALEQRERFDSDNVEIRGVVLEEKYNEELEIRTTIVKIQTENGAKAMQKPVGKYITIEAPNMAIPDDAYHMEVSKELAKHLKYLIPKEKKEQKVLVVGLGNRNVTPDALGPFVTDHLNINRHIIKEYGRYAIDADHINSVSAIAPGVMGQTGMETVEIVRGIVEETSPDYLIVIDALAARNSKRLNRTIQIADSGINPGSGVGNHRNAINRKTVGVPVIAIGVPTVVDAATIVSDAMEQLMKYLETPEKNELINKVVAPHLNGMFVTPKDIDEMTKRISYTISEGLNIFFSEL